MSTSQLCDAFREQVDDLVGHDLSPEESARLVAHARHCSRCASEWRSALDRASALASLTPWSLEAAGVKPPVAGATADAVFGRLAAGEGAPSWADRWIRPRLVRRLAMAAGILVLLGGGYLTWHAVGSPLLFGGNGALFGGNGNITANGNTNHNSSAAPSLSELDENSIPLNAQNRRVLLESAMREEWLQRATGVPASAGPESRVAPGTQTVDFSGGAGRRRF
jgi:hypothetical protein